MDDLVEKASSSADAKHSKPDPDIFAAALRKVGMRPEQALALGDTPYDAEAAGKLGIPVIGLTSGGWKEEDLRDAGWVEVYHDPADLLLHFNESLLSR
jgi:phosphoglycolate phosphatase-like HAD superfamily hydrolase